MIDNAVERRDGLLIRTIQLNGTRYVSSIQDLSDEGLDPSSAWWQSFIRGSDSLVPPPRSKTLRVVDAFCGSGGLSLGLTLAAASLGYETEFCAAIDTDALALEIHKANFRSTPILSSASSLVDYHIWGQDSDIRFAYAPEPLHPVLSNSSPVDVFIAGPPCEGHSNLNNHTRRADPRNELYTTAVALGVSVAANCIIIENVPSVLKDKRNVVPRAEALLRSCGYGVHKGVLKADALGGPQRRARFFLVAIRGEVGQQQNWIEVVGAALSAPASPASWAIGDLVDREPRDLLDTVPNPTVINQERIDYLF